MSSWKYSIRKYGNVSILDGPYRHHYLYKILLRMSCHMEHMEVCPYWELNIEKSMTRLETSMQKDVQRMYFE